jgi:hypothetical protein
MRGARRKTMGRSVFETSQCFAENHIDVPLGPSFKLGHTLEACLFIHSRRLEVIARYQGRAIFRLRFALPTVCASVMVSDRSFEPAWTARVASTQSRSRRRG